MKIRNKIYWSIGLVIPGTVLYYLIFVLVDKLFSKWCKTHYCFEFPPYADSLAIYVAVVGLYFVITSLNEWKTQEKYFKSRANFEILSEMCAVLKNIDKDLLNLKMTDLSKHNKNDLLSFMSFTQGNLNNYLNEHLIFMHDKVKRKISTLEQEKEAIVDKSNGLLQEDINKIFSAYSEIILRASIQLSTRIEKKNNDSMEDYQQELDSLYTTFHDDIDNLLIKLEKLEKDLNNFLDG